MRVCACVCAQVDPGSTRLQELPDGLYAGERPQVRVVSHSKVVSLVKAHYPTESVPDQ